MRECLYACGWFSYSVLGTTVRDSNYKIFIEITPHQLVLVEKNHQHPLVPRQEDNLQPPVYMQVVVSVCAGLSSIDVGAKRSSFVPGAGACVGSSFVGVGARKVVIYCWCWCWCQCWCKIIICRAWCKNIIIYCWCWCHAFRTKLIEGLER